MTVESCFDSPTVSYATEHELSDTKRGLYKVSGMLIKVKASSRSGQDRVVPLLFARGVIIYQQYPTVPLILEILLLWNLIHSDEHEVLRSRSTSYTAPHPQMLCSPYGNPLKRFPKRPSLS